MQDLLVLQGFDCYKLDLSDRTYVEMNKLAGSFGIVCRL